MEFFLTRKKKKCPTSGERLFRGYTKFQGCVRYGTYRGIPPVFPPVYTLPSVSVRSVQASIPYRKFRYARYSPPYPTENLGIRRKNTESSVGVPVRPPYPTENLGTLGIDLHTLPKISVRSVQPSYPTENLGIRRENTESSVGVSVQPHTLPKEIQIAVQCAVPLPFPKHTTLLLHPPTEHHHPPWGTRYRALMSSEATSQDEGGASGANPGSGGSSSSQAPTPEVAEISQGNSVATISPAKPLCRGSTGECGTQTRPILRHSATSPSCSPLRSTPASTSMRFV